MSVFIVDFLDLAVLRFIYIYSVLLPAVRILTHFFDHFSALPWFVLWAGGRRAGMVSMEH